MFRETARIGSRVKHYGQQYTSYSTATVIGFKNVGTDERPWIKVLVEHDSDESAYAFKDGWDWDRTEVIR